MTKTDDVKNGDTIDGLPASGWLTAIVDSSDDAIVSKNLSGTIMSWNKGAERLFGYTAEEAIGRHISLIIPDNRIQEEDMILGRIRSGRRVEQFETVRVRKDGKLVDVSLAISPVKDVSGRVVGASKIARDVSRRKQYEEQLRAFAEELESKVQARTLQLRELSARLLEAQDEERRRIARDLHDSAGQMIAALSLSLAIITQHSGGNIELAQAAEQCEELVRGLSKEIRTLSYLLHPPLLDEAGLSGAVAVYVQGVVERSGLKIDLNVREDFGRLPEDLETAIFRIVQEALTNIHRHSGSKTAQIQLDRQGDRIALTIEDQGVGMPAEKLAEIQAQGSGVGIAGMRERVRHLHGEMTIQSDHNGTKVSVNLPVVASDI